MEDQNSVRDVLKNLERSGSSVNSITALKLYRAGYGSGTLRTSAPENLPAFRRDHPDYQHNVFVMCSFRKDVPESEETWKAVKASLAKGGFHALRADMKTYGASRQLWENLITYMHGCNYGVAVLETYSGDEFNPNIALEYGFMRALGKTVLLLKELDVKLRADLLGTVWVPFSREDIETSVNDAIKRWCREISPTGAAEQLDED